MGNEFLRGGGGGEMVSFNCLSVSVSPWYTNSLPEESWITALPIASWGRVGQGESDSG